MKTNTINKLFFGTVAVGVISIFSILALTDMKSGYSTILNRLENNARREKSLTRLIDEQYPIVASTLQAYGLPVPENPENYCIGSERGTICAAINERSEIKERVAALQLELKEASPQYRRGLLFALGTGIGMFAGMAYLVWQKHKNDIAEESERASNYKAV